MHAFKTGENLKGKEEQMWGSERKVSMDIRGHKMQEERTRVIFIE
jgi:hypothetical protein